MRETRKPLIALLVLLSLCAPAVLAASYDVLIENGRLYDGTGGAPIDADLPLAQELLQLAMAERGEMLLKPAVKALTRIGFLHRDVLYAAQDRDPRDIRRPRRNAITDKDTDSAI